MLSRSLLICSRCPPIRVSAASGFSLTLQPARPLWTAPRFRLCAPFKPQSPGGEHVRKLRQKLRITMSEDVKARKLKAIEQARLEQPPEGLVAKLKFYIKRYWYIAIPTHTVNCAIWFALLYLAVRSGIDVVSLLETLHMPTAIIDKVKHVPESAGFAVVALILYKIVLPLRYATTIALIRVIFDVLKRTGLLRTAREIEFKMRSRYEVLNKRRLSAASQKAARDHDKPVKRMSKVPPPKSTK